ncbi:hypothetical protein F5887DRAFT_105021 [Amanita rubescens]|nr:hypothetical protein F5887DRAFT_105021 [Amanita rubescens]
MANQTPTKKWTSRMGGVMRRASTALISPARPGTPDQGERTSTDIDREDDAVSTSGKKPKKSRSNTSLSNIFTRSATPPPQPAASTAAAAPHQPSPIAESPAREAAESQEEITAPAATKSPLSQEVKPPNTSDPQEVVTSPTAGYVAPPLEEDTSNPGAFTDDVDDLPSSDPIPDPYAQPAAEEDAASPPPQQSPLPIERAPSDASQPTEPSVVPTAQDSTDLLVSSGGEQEDRSAPIPIPQKQGTFFEYIRSSPEDDDEVPPPPPSKQQPQQQTPPQPQTQMPTIIPIPIPIVTSPSQQGQQAPRTPPRQVDLDMYTSEHEPWSQHSVEETPMSIPPRPVARSLTSRSDSSEDIPATSRSLENENPFDDPVAPRLPPSHGNGPIYSSSPDNRAVMMSMPTALVPGNSKAK